MHINKHYSIIQEIIDVALQMLSGKLGNPLVKQGLLFVPLYTHLLLIYALKIVNMVLVLYSSPSYNYIFFILFTFFIN